MSTARMYSSRRTAIVQALTDLFKTINGAGRFTSNLFDSVYPNLKYFSDVKDFPAVCVIAGSEDRDYQGGGYKDRYLSIKLVIFVNEENPLTKMDAVLEDLETLVEENGRLAYIDRQGNTQYTHDITVLSISTDEGTLDPISIGEMSIRVHY
jgi:hypothetical protein